jgi:transposase
MKATPELEAEIVRLHYAEHWKVGTIAAQLDTHPDVVRRVLGLSTARPPSQLRPRLVDPYRPFIDETLQRYPKLLATRLYDMIRERGFTGSIRTLREHVAAVRPKRRREIYLSTETMPGEQAQVDWAYVDKLVVPGGERALWLFVMVLAHSRALWAEFVLDLSVHSLVRSLVRASAWFGGVTRQWLFEDVPRNIFVLLCRPPICGRGIDLRGCRCNGAAVLGTYGWSFTWALTREALAAMRLRCLSDTS